MIWTELSATEVEHTGNDIALFERVRKNDRLALNTLFAAYYQKLCAFAVTYLKSTDDAEEAVADVFFILWKNRHQIDIKKNVRSYLFTCVRHECLAVLKKHRPDFTEIDETTATSVTDHGDPEQVFTLKELNEQIDHVVDTLPEKCRQIFIMSRYDGLRYKEIAEILNIAEKTVENQLVKATGILRYHLLKEKRTPPPVNIKLT